MLKKLNIFISIIIFLLLLFFNKEIYCASISVTDENGIKDSLTENVGIDIKNMQLNGQTVQFGTFEGFSGEIEGFDNLDKGVFMTAGSAEQNIFGNERPTFISTALSGSYINYQMSYASYPKDNGDDDLENIATYGCKSFDTACIEFDAKSDSEYISFQYIFASEEFDQPPKFNDLFALYANGDNIAVVEELETEYERDKTVSMMSVKNTAYHYDNINGTNFGFLGYTSLLSCGVNVTPGEWVHFKLVIGDLSDPIYDSATFISAFSNEPMKEHEKNPNPSTRGIINLKKNISVIKLTLADGQVVTDAIINDSGIEGLKTNLLKLEDYFVVLDEELLHGATLEVEYVFEVNKTTYEEYKDFIIIDELDDKFNFSKDKQVLTSYKTNEDYGWNIENEKLICKSNNDLNYDEKKEIKLLLSSTLDKALDEDMVYKNSCLGKIEYQKNGIKDITVIKATAENVVVIPPFGVKNDKNHILIIIFVIILVTVSSYIIIKKKQK